MACCEKCWGDAYLRYRMDPSKTQADHYRDLLEERKDRPCSEAEQKGTNNETE
jgi:hypothetical protein